MLLYVCKERNKVSHIYFDLDCSKLSQLYMYQLWGPLRYPWGEVHHGCVIYQQLLTQESIIDTYGP